MTQYHLSQANLVLKIGYFEWNLSIYLVEKALCWPQGNGISYLGDFKLFLYIKVRKWNTQTAMDVCPYDTASYLFSGVILGLKMVILSKFERSFGRKDLLLIMRGLYILSETLPTIIICLREIKKYSSSNGCLFLWHSIPFPEPIWCSKLLILLEV